MSGPALPPPPGQSDPDGRAVAVSSTPCSIRRATVDGHRPVGPRRGPQASLTHGRPLRKRHERMGDHYESLGSHRRRSRKRALGLRGRTRCLGGRAQPLRHHLHRVRAAGPAVYLATTQDFTTVERYGVIKQPEDKNAALLPHRVDGSGLLSTARRPSSAARGEILLSALTTLPAGARPSRSCSPRRRLVGLAPDRYRATAAPHGARLAARLPRCQGNGFRRHLSSGSRPARPRGADQGAEPLFELGAGALAPYERTGDVPNVVFPCGLIHDATSGQDQPLLRAADCSICLATHTSTSLVDAVLTSPPDDGAPL